MSSSVTPEPAQRMAHAIADDAGSEAAHRQSGHEARPHGARGVDGDAEHPPHHAEPEQLIDQGAYAGSEEQDRERNDEERVVRTDRRRQRAEYTSFSERDGPSRPRGRLSTTSNFYGDG